MKKQEMKRNLSRLKEEIKRLTSLTKLPKTKATTNNLILARDDYKCRLCLSDIDLQVHHITPIRIGGKNDYDNLLTLCSCCHHFIHYCNPMIRFGQIGLSHKELTKAGLQIAKAQGKKLGRPSLSVKGNLTLSEKVAEEHISEVGSN